jgi:hypothetical protein
MDADGATVRAAGKVSEAVETTERDAGPESISQPTEE